MSAFNALRSSAPSSSLIASRTATLNIGHTSCAIDSVVLASNNLHGCEQVDEGFVSDRGLRHGVQASCLRKRPLPYDRSGPSLLDMEG